MERIRKKKGKMSALVALAFAAAIGLALMAVAVLSPGPAGADLPACADVGLDAPQEQQYEVRYRWVGHNRVPYVPGHPELTAEEITQLVAIDNANDSLKLQGSYAAHLAGRYDNWQDAQLDLLRAHNTFVREQLHTAALLGPNPGIAALIAELNEFQQRAETCIDQQQARFEELAG